MNSLNTAISYSISASEYSEFCAFLETSCGIVLGDNKQYLVNSRLKHLLKKNGLENLGELMTILKSNSDAALKEHTIDSMTTNETSWFRDNYPYDVLKGLVIPALVKTGKRDVRIWSSACSSGQEPYSIAMILHEYNMINPGAISSSEIIATDISPTMLAEAKSGIFDSMSLGRGLSEERKRLYFSQYEGRWKVRDIIINSIIFKEANLMKDFSLLGKFDIIFCRNVLIYFSMPLKNDIISRMSKLLNPGGYLILGGTESMSSFKETFEAVRYQNGIIHRLK